MKKTLSMLLAVALVCVSLAGCTVEVVEEQNETQEEEKASSLSLIHI